MTSGSADYHDYVIKDGQFVGRFEEMYREIDDPWFCQAKVDSFKNRLLCGIVQNEAPVGDCLDIGCGLGAFARMLQATTPAATWYACDISETAIDRARTAIPGVSFFRHDIRQARLPFEDERLVAITMCELMWYVLPELPQVLSEIQRVLRPDGRFYLLQYFLDPADQQYGREIISAPQDLLAVVRHAGFTINEQVTIGAAPPCDVLLINSKAKQ